MRRASRLLDYVINYSDVFVAFIVARVVSRALAAGIWKMDEPVGVGVWRKKDGGGNWFSEKSEFDADASKKRADHLDHFLKLPSFQQRYELEVKSRDAVKDARQCAGA